MGMKPPFEPWLSRWGLRLDGTPYSQGESGSYVAPVRLGETPAVLKIASNEEEVRGACLMDWYAGQGAAKVFEREGPALLMERATGARDLATMARRGADDEATRVICSVIRELHSRRSRPAPSSLVPMETWFRQLESAASRYGGVLVRSAQAARELLAEPRDLLPLHGDVHHGNVLDFGMRGWLAVDPKGVLGERGFEYANLFRNPDRGVALRPARFMRRVSVVSSEAGLDPKRLLTWIVAYAGLGAAWTMDDGGKDEAGLELAALTSAELER
jgi:streptomycin 6-kinase